MNQNHPQQQQYQKPPETLTMLEAERLLDELLVTYGTPRKKKYGVRNYTIGLLMLDAGLRVGEVVTLLVCQLDTDLGPTNSLRLSPDSVKNNLERTIPLTTRLRNAITAMASNWWHQHPEPSEPYAFTSTASREHITTRQVERFIAAASLRAFGRPCHPHVLRHTFATRLMRTTNIRVVQQLMGHKQLSSTQVYTHPDATDLKNAIDSLSKGETKP